MKITAFELRPELWVPDRMLSWWALKDRWLCWSAHTPHSEQKWLPHLDKTMTVVGFHKLPYESLRLQIDDVYSIQFKLVIIKKKILISLTYQYLNTDKTLPNTCKYPDMGHQIWNTKLGCGMTPFRHTWGKNYSYHYIYKFRNHYLQQSSSCRLLLSSFSRFDE
jgi:hypothetical protein